MSENLLDWHLDWILGLLAALVVLSVIATALLKAILSTLKDIERKHDSVVLGEGYGARKLP